MPCPNCGTENPESAKFCNGCGGSLLPVCSSCGTSNASGARFCSECGAPFTVDGGGATPAAAAAAPRAAPAAERRLVSVLFADLVGFTPFSESRDAEEVRELLSRYFDICRRLIELYGGVVEKFIGDAVMAVWGTPTATEDDAERAVRAALDLVAAVSALGQEVGAEELRARAGVLTGEAAVTIGAEGEGMVAGDLVNTASRVQSVAEPGQVFVGESTRRATEPAIVYEDAGAFELKGKEGLTPLWKAVRIVSGVRGTLKSQGLEAPFVGRDRELRQIKDLFHICAEEKKAQLVSVTGIAGIGKSRLSWEFYKYFDGLAQLVYWHRGRCLAYGEGVTYWALADMVRWRCRIAEDEPPASAQQKLRSTLEEHLLDPEERRFVEPRLAQLLGLGEHEMRDRQDLFAAWRLFFERLADVYPTVLAFEDMQWADASLLDFVEYLLEWSRNHPLYVITLARPELLERRPTWGAGHRNFTSLYLEPLSEQAMEELLTGLVPGLPAALRGQILARAEGVPLYAVETVRMLLDRGALVQEGSVYGPVGTIDTLEVPETLHALIAARLDGLPPGERRLLQDGSVLGKSFTRAGLAALSGDAEADLDPLLSSLVRKEVLSLQSDPRSPEHGQYGFLQDLVRHVAYETLSKRERRTRHLAAAEHLSRALSDEEVAEVVASHLVEAYELAPEADDAAEIRDRARLALVGAGERAGSLGAAAEAQRYFERAGALTDEPLEEATLTDRAGQMAWRGAKPVEARELLERAEARYAALAETRAAARVSARLAEIDFADGHPRQAVDRLETALEALSSGEGDADTALLAAGLGRFLALSGEEDRALTQIEYALRLAETLDLPETLAQALINKAIVLLRVDRLFEARVLLDAAIELAEANDLHNVSLRAHNNLGVVLEASDRFTECATSISRAIELARRVGNRGWESSLVGGAIVTLVLLGRWDQALARAAEVEEIATTSFANRLLLEIVPVYCERGQLEQARQLFELYGAGVTEDPQVVIGRDIAEARLLFSEQRLDEALVAAERATLAARDLGTTSLWFKLALGTALDTALALGNVVKAREFLATLDSLRPGELTPLLKAQQARFRARLATLDNYADPQGEFVNAEQLFRTLETQPLLATTLLEHSEWLLGQGQSEKAEPLLEEAHEIFERLEATPWLGRATTAARAQRPPIPA